MINNSTLFLIIDNFKNRKSELTELDSLITNFQDEFNDVYSVIDFKNIEYEVPVTVMNKIMDFVRSND